MKLITLANNLEQSISLSSDSIVKLEGAIRKLELAAARASKNSVRLELNGVASELEVGLERIVSAFSRLSAVYMKKKAKIAAKNNDALAASGRGASLVSISDDDYSESESPF